MTSRTGYDPSRWVRECDTVLYLGSGGGRICFIAAQIAGPEGRVIGVDANDEMLWVLRVEDDDGHVTRGETYRATEAPACGQGESRC